MLLGSLAHLTAISPVVFKSDFDEYEIIGICECKNGPTVPFRDLYFFTPCIRRAASGPIGTGPVAARR